MPAPAGNFVGLSLGTPNTAPGNFVPLNLGVEWDYVPPDPPEPVIRGLRMATGIAWGTPGRLQRSVASGWSQAPQLRRTTRTGWGNAPLVRRGLEMLWGTPLRYRQTTGMPWRGEMPRTSRTVSMPWRSLPNLRRPTSMAWRGRIDQVRHSTEMPWSYPGLVRLTRGMPWLAKLLSTRMDLRMPWLALELARRSIRLPWGNGKRIPWVVKPEDPEIPEEPPLFPPGNAVGLNLGCAVIDRPGFVPLNLGVYACYAAAPRRRTYVIINDISVVRLPDRTPIEVESIGIAGGVDSWGYSLDMTLADAAHLALLKPGVSGPRQVEVALNGYVWTFIIESYNHRREFGTRGVTVAGRSRTALLAAPYAPARAKVTTEERTVAQLVDEELASTGYTGTYDTVDWIVPAGAWYYDATTPLDAITKIAEASGAVVQSDPETLDLVVRPRYPVSPWEWTESAPDATVLDDIVTSDSLEVRSLPLYDAVIVAGEIQGKGVIAHVVKSGEAASIYAPQASHQLTNVAAAGQERGRNILSDRGEQASIDLTLPLFATPLAPGETGRVLPLDLVEVLEQPAAEGEDPIVWHGLCIAYRIDARKDDKATVIEQTITLERHYSDAD